MKLKLLLRSSVTISQRVIGIKKLTLFCKLLTNNQLPNPLPFLP